MKVDIVVVDERKAPLHAHNTEAGQGSIDAVNEADVDIRVTQDGLFVKKGVGRVGLITPKSENELSAEKADRESAAFQERHRGSDAERDSHGALTKAMSVWGHEDIEQAVLDAHERGEVDLRQIVNKLD